MKLSKPRTKFVCAWSFCPQWLSAGCESHRAGLHALEITPIPLLKAVTQRPILRTETAAGRTGEATSAAALQQQQAFPTAECQALSPVGMPHAHRSPPRRKALIIARAHSQAPKLTITKATGIKIRPFSLRQGALKSLKFENCVLKRHHV